MFKMIEDNRYNEAMSRATKAQIELYNTVLNTLDELERIKFDKPSIDNIEAKATVSSKIADTKSMIKEVEEDILNSYLAGIQAHREVQKSKLKEELLNDMPKYMEALEVVVSFKDRAEGFGVRSGDYTGLDIQGKQAIELISSKAKKGFDALKVQVGE